MVKDSQNGYKQTNETNYVSNKYYKPMEENRE